MGYYSFGNTMPDKNKITRMFSLLESRGKDASGFAYINNNELKVIKLAEPSSNLVKSFDWKQLALPRIMIMHTRLKTQGEPSNNMNNHPLFTKKGLAIVHNGMIYNDKEIFGRKEKRDAEVDSEAILSILASTNHTKSTNERIKKLFDKLEGGFAVASIDKDFPEKLLLIRKDNPLELYYNSRDDIMYFCSEREIMQEALGITKQTKRGFTLGEGNYHHFSVDNNHAVILNKDGVEIYKQFFPRRTTWNYSTTVDYVTDDEMILECPYCLESTIYYWGRLFNRCEHCGQVIAEEDMYV